MRPHALLLVLFFALVAASAPATSVAGVLAAAGQGQYQYSKGLAYDCPPQMAVTVLPARSDPSRSDIDVYVTPSVRTTALLSCALPATFFSWRNVAGDSRTGWTAARDVGCTHEELRLGPAGVLSSLNMVRANKCTSPRTSETWTAVLVWTP